VRGLQLGGVEIRGVPRRTEQARAAGDAGEAAADTVRVEQEPGSATEARARERAKARDP
jgi:hypothetical protein